MAQKSEKFFKEYLSKITDEQLIQFYDDLEWTPFPVLVLKEYQNRFKSKNKKEVLQKLKTHSKNIKKRFNRIKSEANQKSSKGSKKLKSKTKKLGRSLEKNIRASSEKNLQILEKLGDLNQKGIITKKEFEEKKKEILKRI